MKMACQHQWAHSVLFINENRIDIFIGKLKRLKYLAQFYENEIDRNHFLLNFYPL